MRMSRSFAFVSSTVLALGAVVTVGSAAQAATPTCNSRLSMTGYLPGTAGTAEVPSHGTNTSCILTSGVNTGTDPGTSPVYWLQYNLNKCYGQALTIDGAYGAKTAAAVKYAQSVAGVSADGVYGPNTRSAIKWETEHTGAHGALTRGCLAFSSLR